MQRRPDGGDRGPDAGAVVIAVAEDEVRVGGEQADGVFILDFLRALPVDGAYEFAARYYAQYPAISVGYRPPGFPLVGSRFNCQAICCTGTCTR